MGDDGTMAKGTRYTPEFKAKAVRLLTESCGSYPSETKAIEQVARDPGVAPETPLRWRDKADVTAVYGCRKTHARSSARGRDPAGIGRGQVTNVMRESGIRGVRRGGTPVTTKPARGTGGGPDLVERGFEAEAPNRPHRSLGHRTPERTETGHYANQAAQAAPL